MIPTSSSYGLGRAPDLCRLSRTTLPGTLWSTAMYSGPARPRPSVARLLRDVILKCENSLSCHMRLLRTVAVPRGPRDLDELVRRAGLMIQTCCRTV